MEGHRSLGQKLHIGLIICHPHILGRHSQTGLHKTGDFILMLWGTGKDSQTAVAAYNTGQTLGQLQIPKILVIQSS